MSNKQFWAWGINEKGQIGVGDTESVWDAPYQPTEITGQTFAKICATGSYHCFGIRADGTLYGWGSNRNGQLGLGDIVDRYEPTLIGSDTWLDMACGDDHTIGIKSDGTLWAAGEDMDGGSDALTFLQVDAGSWTAVAVYGTYLAGTMARKADGSVWEVSSTGLTQISSANSKKLCNNYVIAQDDTLWMVSGGALVLSDSGSWLTVSHTQQHALGIKSDGTLWGRGENGYGQLGLGDSTDRAAWTQIDNGEWSEIAAGWRHSIATKADGSLYAWGSNWYSQLGFERGTYPDIYLTPTRVIDLMAESLAASQYTSYGAIINNTFWTNFNQQTETV